MKEAKVSEVRETPRKSSPDHGAVADGALLPPDAAAPTNETLALGGGAYEGAQRLSRQMASWRTVNASADRDTLPHKSILDARSKDIARNDAYIDNGIEKYKDSVVGAKFTLNCAPNIDYLRRTDKRLDETWMQEFQEEVESLWEVSAESESRWIDGQRTKTATEIARLGVASKLMQGEVLMSSEWLRRSRRPFNTAFLMIDPTRLDDPNIELGRSLPSNIRKGVRLNAQGEPVGYFIMNEHPHDYMPMFKHVTTGRSFQYTPRETPWGRRNILHVFDEKRVGQTRGVSKMVSSLKEMKMTKEFRDIMLQNAITVSSFAAAIESELPADKIYEMLGGADIEANDFQNGVADYAGGFLGALSEYLKSSNGTMMNGVKIPHLFPGTKLNLMPAGQGGPLGTDFEKSLLRYLAACMNMSFEQFSGDMTGVNYSTLKGAINETQKHMKVEKRLSAERIMNFMYGNWLEEMIVNGMVTSLPRNAPAFWDGMNREAYCQAEWFNTGRGQIEELKETQAAVQRIKNRLSTFEDEHAHLGKDWRRAMRQMKREEDFAKFIELDLRPDQEQNMTNAATGAVREKDAPDGESGDGE